MEFKTHIWIRTLLIGAAFFLGFDYYAHAANYYISNSGNDSANGTSPSTPWATFANANSMTFNPGDTINLACGSSWNQSLTPGGSGNAIAPITITSYNNEGCSTEYPVIYGNNTSGESLISLNDQSYWIIENLELRDSDFGIKVAYGPGFFDAQSITIAGCYLHAMHVTFHGSYAIFFTGDPNNLPSSSQWTLSGINLNGNHITDVEQALMMYQGTGINGVSSNTWQNIVIKDNYMWNLGDSALGVYGVSNALIIDNWMWNIVTEAVPGGTTGNFQSTTDGVTWVNNYIDGTANTGSTDQTGLDVETQDINTNLWNNYFGSTYGPGVEMLQLSGRPNDYLTNTNFLSNIFDGDGTENIEDATPGSAIQSDSQTSSVITGTLNNNIFYQASNNFLSRSGPNSFSQSNNLTAAQGSTYYFAANWNSFKGTQGASGWYYQSTDSNNNKINLTYDDVSQTWSSPRGGYISLMSMQAPSSTLYCNMITWVAPSTGTISLRGRVLMDTTGSSGVGAFWGYVHNGVWTPEWNQSISGNDQTGYDLTMDDIPVTAGDSFSFYVFPNANNDANAIVSWQPSLTYITSDGGNNVLINPTWATGSLSPWNVYLVQGSTSDVYVQAGSVPPGSYQGAPYDLAMWSATSSYQLAAYQNVTGQPSGASFTASVYATTASNSTGVNLEVQDGYGGPVLCRVTIPPNTGWTRYSCSGTVPSDGQLTFDLGTDVEPATAWIEWDNATLTVRP